MCATKSLAVPAIMEDGTIDAERYIKDVLSTAFKSSIKMLQNNWTYQKDETGLRIMLHDLNQN